VAGAVTDLDGTLLGGVEDLERGDELAGGVGSNAEASLGECLELLGEAFGAAVERIEAARKAGGEAPHDVLTRLHGGSAGVGSGARGRAGDRGDCPGGGLRDEGAAIEVFVASDVVLVHSSVRRVCEREGDGRKLRAEVRPPQGCSVARLTWRCVASIFRLARRFSPDLTGRAEGAATGSTENRLS